VVEEKTKVITAMVWKTAADEMFRLKSFD